MINNISSTQGINQRSHKNASLYKRLRFRASLTKARGPILWYRHRHFKPSDVFLASYPRSGSTWLRFMLFEILTGQSSEFANVNAAFRPVGEHRHGRPLFVGEGRLIGTHEKYRHHYQHAFYLVRDVRDVALSEYAREQEAGFIRRDFTSYLRALLEGHNRHGSWQSHVTSWLHSPMAQRGELHVIRFDQLRNNTSETLANLVGFLGFEVSHEAIQNAITNNSVKKMREKEDRVHSGRASGKIPRRPYKGSTEEGRFVRQGSIAGWRAHFTEAQARLVDQYAGDVLRLLGYPLASELPAASESTVQMSVTR